MKNKKKLLVLFAVIFVFFMSFLLIKYNSSYAIYRDTLNTKVYLSLLDPSATYRVTFDSNGGTPTPTAKDVPTNGTIGPLPSDVEYTGKNFIGWYTDRYTGTKVTPTTQITGDITLYAHWADIVCKKATSQHTETCATGGGCLKHAYGVGDTIRYGTIPTTDTPKKGYAYDCDVNNDGTFDASTERFYYIREDTTGGADNAVLVHYTSFDEDGQMDSSDTRKNYTYDAGKAYLPGNTVWTNPALTAIDGKVSRYINEEDVKIACGDPIVYNSNAYLSGCQYLMENTKYQSGSLGRSGVWIDKINNTIYRIQASTVVVEKKDTTSSNTVRPVIEIPYNTLEGYKERNSYRVTFNYKGGTGSHPYYDVYEDDPVGTLPQAAKEGFTFDGWYLDDNTFTNPLTEQTVITGNIEVFAKWDEIIDNLEYVFYLPGSCNFNGSTSNITSDNNTCISTINPQGHNIDYTAGNFKFIDTGIALYSHDNIEKDYEIGFTVETYNPSANVNRAVFMNAKKEETGYPGTVVRRDELTDNVLLQSRKTSAANEQVTIQASNLTSVVIIRRDGKMYYKLNGGAETYLHDIDYNPEFNVTTWFGAGPQNASGSVVNRYLVGTLSDMYIRLESNTVLKNKITFHATPGICDTAEKEVKRGYPAGELPTPTYAGHYFDGWYTASTGGTKVDENTVITSDIDVYAHWKNIYIVEFHGGNGTVSPQTIYQVADGKSIGSANLPTATYAGHYFVGWYTAPTGGTKIDGTETISADEHYYAQYKDYYYVTFDANGGTVDVVPNPVPVVDGDTIGQLPIASKTGEAFLGWFTSGGTQVDGTEPITSDVTYHARYSTICHVTFDGNGGTPYFGSKDVNYGTAIGELPTADHTDITLELEGWYLDLNDPTTKADETSTIITDNVTYHAKWVTTSKVAMIGVTKYNTLALAVAAVPTNGVKTTITMLNNTSENVTINGGRNVLIDLNGKTVSHPTNGAAQVFTVGGNSVGTLELTNGTVTSNKDSGLINVNSSGTLTVNTGTTLRMTGKRQAIYVNGGTLYVLDGNISNVQDRGAIHILGSGNVTITGGTVTSTNFYGVYNEAGNLTIGTKDGTIDTTKPIIQGGKYGVVGKTTYKFYDGILMGKTGAVGKMVGSTDSVDTGETMISEIDDDAIKVNDISGDYKQLYLDYNNNKYKIRLDPNGGIVSTSVISVEPGDRIGAIPTPTNGAYTFDGWYDLVTDNPVNELTIPQGDMDLYAKWNYTPTHGTLDLMNNAMRAYYNNISTWKLTESTFLTQMSANFNQYNCLECDNNSSSPYQSCPATGEVQCDKPKGYTTGVAGTLNVYEYDSINDTKTLIDYVTVTSNGTLYDLIPGKTYYWELDSDNNVYGTVVVTGERRILEAGGVRNIRDLGGFAVDVDNDGTTDGVVDYGRMFRGPKLTSNADVTSLETLGITEEIDLRGSQNEPKLSNYVGREIRNYEIAPEFNNGTYYNQFRSALSATIDDIINGENVYFHCAIGTDRTGTMSWFLEGLLGVSEEDRVEDYELSYFYGLLNRHRFYRNQPGSGITHRFEYMYQTYPTNVDIYNYYTNNGTEHVQQVQAFRDAVITYNQP